MRVGCVPDLPLQRLQCFLGALHVRDLRVQPEVAHLHSLEQMSRLRSGELDLALLHMARQDSEIKMAPLFQGEPLAAFVPIGHRLAARETVGPDDLRGEVFALAARAHDPELHDRLVGLIRDAGYRFRYVRETDGPEPRDLLLAVAEGLGVTLAPWSLLSVVGDADKIVARVALDPAPPMPDTTLAWPATPARLGEAVAAANGIASELHGLPERR